MNTNPECTSIVNANTENINAVNTNTSIHVATANIECEILSSSELCNDSGIRDPEPTTNSTCCLNKPDGNVNDLTSAKHNLQQYANGNCFSLHDVPGDGNCLYHAILYQLKNNNVISTTVHDLRELVAVFLEQHSDMYMPFVTAPIVSDSVLNSDTEIPSAVDARISSVANPDTRSALIFARYVDRVRSGSWRDHVVIAAVANMFHVTVNVVQATQSSCTVSITSPVNAESNFEINLGLIMQYHFVGLDKQVIPVSPNDRGIL